MSTTRPARRYVCLPPGSTAAPAAAIASHNAPCSPRRVKASTARSTGGWCSRVRSMRRSAVSRAPSTAARAGLEADLLGFRVEPDVDDLREVDRDLRVGRRDLVP